jgi:MFS transporter, VNT family, synaptic vesicle glycoprotein 2
VQHEQRVLDFFARSLTSDCNVEIFLQSDFFIPEFFTKISLWTDASRGPATVCEIFSSTHSVVNQTDVIVSPICVEKLSFSTFIHVYEICIVFAICYASFSLIINRVGKLFLLVVVLVTTSLSALLLMLVRIPEAASYIYITMILAGLGISIVNASTVELFPTNMRSEHFDF